MQQYMLKAAREAKERTSWANQNAEYENALSAFVEAVLDSKNNAEFVSDFQAFQRRIAAAGMVNSLSQVLIKLTAPGAPDIYQGNELSTLRLVDPDNRRPVDFALRQKLLREIMTSPCREHKNMAREFAAQLLSGSDMNGCPKLFLTWKSLHARRINYELFQSGKYVPLTVKGNRAEHVLAFARDNGDKQAVIVVPRLCARIIDSGTSLSNSEIWKDTWIEAPNFDHGTTFQNMITGERYSPTIESDEVVRFEVSALMKDFPWVLLISNKNQPVYSTNAPRSNL